MRRARTLHTTTRIVEVAAPVDDVWRVVASGERGPHWYADAAPFRFRGALDRLVGGAGRRWAPPGRPLLEAGDHVGFWEVERVEHGPRPHLLLRAAVRAPGTVRMETTASPTPDGGTRVAVRISLEPDGVLGRAYLFADLPARAVVSELTALTLLTELRRAASSPERTPTPPR